MWTRVFAPVLALGVAAVLFFRPDEFNPKGGGDPGRTAIEALCFDENAVQTKALKASGECAAPGLIKLVYASARPVEKLHVEIRAGEEKRLEQKLDHPKERSTIPGHVKLAPGEQLDIFLDGEKMFTVRGAAQ
jgi:hypothetical protein